MIHAHAQSITAHRAFRAVLLAMAYPGSLQAAPPHSTFDELLRAVVNSLWDESTEADVVIVPSADASIFARARTGTELEPQRGATILIAGAPAQTSVRLSGPGIAHTATVELPLSRDAIAARNAACENFPLGVDCIFLRSEGIMALPRTTRVEPL